MRIRRRTIYLQSSKIAFNDKKIKTNVNRLTQTKRQTNGRGH